jgi:hypothetical protein
VWLLLGVVLFLYRSVLQSGLSWVRGSEQHNSPIWIKKMTEERERAESWVLSMVPKICSDVIMYDITPIDDIPLVESSLLLID